METTLSTLLRKLPRLERRSGPGNDSFRAPISRIRNRSTLDDGEIFSVIKNGVPPELN